VGHVEAGLRTGHKYIPYPEEINRSLLAPLADLHFAPTERARLALLKEGVSKDKILVTGNTVIDALLWVRARVRQEPPALSSDLIADVKGHRTVLVTGHRRESFGCAFENICLAIRDTADTFEDVLIVYPVHLNPNVREPVGRILSGHDRIRLIEPQPYGSFVWLMDHAEAILTDSGGVQEEAPSLGKPVLVMRETTERVEGLEDGSARLVGVARESIAGELSRLLRTEAPGRATAPSSRNPYGDGTAARKIVEAIERHWKHQTQRGVASARPGG
jgi:UDP-N-acetylglucosamine 2-epimerase (non-hydrolysing)